MKTYINGHCIEQVLTNAVELTTAQYNALPAAQKSSGTYIITDAEAPNIEANNVSYDMGGGIITDVQTAIDNKVSKSGDTMTGNLFVDRGSSGDSNVLIGGSVSRGILRLHHTNGKYANIYPYEFTDNRNITLPDKTGTIALTNDLDISITETRFYLARPQGLASIEVAIPFSGRKPSSVNVTNVKYYTGSAWANLTVESTSIMDNCIVFECTLPSGFEQGKVYWGQGQISATY